MALAVTLPSGAGAWPGTLARSSSGTLSPTRSPGCQSLCYWGNSLKWSPGGTLYLINRGVGKAGWNTASPLSISNYSFSEPKWINLTYYSLVPELIYSWYDLSSEQYPSSPPLTVTTFEFITCWEIAVLQVWRSSDYPLKRWPRDIKCWPLCWPYFLPVESNCGMIFKKRNIKSTPLLFVIWSYLCTSREVWIHF